MSPFHPRLRMNIVPRDLELSRRRAPDRDATLIYLACVGTATLWELSEALGIRPSRVVGIMEGLEREYAVDLSLTVQRAARKVGRREARRYTITRLGRKVAEEALERVSQRGSQSLG